MVQPYDELDLSHNPLVSLSDKQFSTAIRKNGGATRVAADGGAAPDSGYFVSLPGHERTLKFAGSDAVARHRASLLADPSAPRYQGGWVDGKTRSTQRTYLDASDHIPDRAQAILQGHVQQQIGVYEAHTGRTLYMKDHPPKMPARIK